jgi:hypothetical protein
MPESLTDMEHRRAAAADSGLGDFRAGSITGTVDRRSNPGCHCHRQGQWSASAVDLQGEWQDRERELRQAPRPAQGRGGDQAFRRYGQPERSFVEVDEKICRARLLADTLTAEEKKARAIDTEIAREASTLLGRIFASVVAVPRSRRRTARHRLQVRSPDAPQRIAFATPSNCPGRGGVSASVVSRPPVMTANSP